jgi:uncharacterized protein (TIGR03435 family)
MYGRYTAAAAVLAVHLPLIAMAQEFEAASVKLSGPPGPHMRFGVDGGPGTSSPGTITWSTTSLVTLLATAYKVRPDQIANPETLNRAGFDVVAKVPAGATKEQIPAMLRKVLEERFHLTTHTETRDGAVYMMSVARTGSKLKAADESAKPPGELRAIGNVQVDRDFFPVAVPGDGATLTFNGTVHLAARAVTTSKLAELLTAGAGRPVIDRTQLTGVYDIRLIFSPEESVHNAPLPPGFTTQTDSPQDNIFTALQHELGLRLDPGKAPVKFIIVDHMDRQPIDN